MCLTVATDFDGAALRQAIRDSQQKGQWYREFLQRAVRAGVQGYFTFLRGQRVTYLGRQVDHHIEWFSGAGPKRTFARDLLRTPDCISTGSNDEPCAKTPENDSCILIRYVNVRPRKPDFAQAYCNCVCASGTRKEERDGEVAAKMLRA